MRETSSQPGSTSVRIDAEKLLKEMTLRGWNQVDLAAAAGISQPTVSTALRGEQVSARSAKAMFDAIERVPPAKGMDKFVVASS